MSLAKFQKTLARGRQESERDPERVLGRELGNRFMAYRRQFEAAESGEGLAYPLHLDIDLTTVCQLACPMFPAGRGGEMENKFPGFGLFLDEGLYLEAVREAEKLGTPSIRFGLTGEPLLKDDIDLWVLEASKRGFIDLALITNGQLLDQRLSENLIKAGLTRMMISVDAASEETYERVRPGGNFDRLVRNIETFLRVREKLGSKLPLLRLSFVNTKINQAEAKAFKEKFSPLADYLAFQDYLDLMGRADLRVNPVKRLPKNGGFYCPDPLTRLAIHADGGLFPCCSDFGRLEPLGNLKYASLKEVWNSPQANKLRGLEGRSSLPCQECLKASGIEMSQSGQGESLGPYKIKVTDSGDLALNQSGPSFGPGLGPGMEPGMEPGLEPGFEGPKSLSPQVHGLSELGERKDLGWYFN
ncbi:MAG: radical SAM protein [Deltaproteobacteria bacterium]|jgi:radical SAM protein with 4Fe4S-binding SPASM domain|nr:radical SAM protein [Deltaproteobacteria bacterium]